MATAPHYTRLVADIGGTNARFALLRENARDPELEQTLPCAQFADLAAAAAHYLKAQSDPPVREAAVAVATPVTSDTIKLTNSPWTFSVAATRQSLGLQRLLMLNDFTALALALPALRTDEYRQVGGGAPAQGKPIGLLGAGTGLGVSGLFPAGNDWIPIEGEGGHTAFSPANDREAAVLHEMWHEYAHVSTERLASGPGLLTIYTMLTRIHGVPLEATTPEQVARRGMSAQDRYCAEALEMFCGILGTAAANLCVTLGALGGIFVGGGIVPALGDWFDRSSFRSRFEAKGRFRAYVSAVPTYVITASYPGLRGVARAFDR